MNEFHISWEGLLEYFLSISGNGLLELTVFITVVLCAFYGRHLWMSRQIRRWRQAIPLSIGGWGTRGKSGTERLKAAIFNALGYSVISKTTGCEAMFIYTPPFGDPKEMFLFRPYDKATIWEQANLLKISKELSSEVFLWECMALTPSYVRILQQDWMTDDLATLTNTFPDHEDLQGPAGYNIPEVMTEFVSKGRQVVTTEESMLPILKESARVKGAQMDGVGWLQAGMIPDELMERFPYDEHPFNIALVCSMAHELGFTTDRAIKEMADRVVADLGVLKTYPRALVQGRQLEFVMGMSANERFGCLGNWTRMGFDQEESLPEKGVWISTVVNNRADRIARSEVFARILVHDVHVDRHVLIGTNLSGLKGYIENERQIYNGKLWGNEGKLLGPDISVILEKEALALRIPLGLNELKARLQFLLNVSPGDLGSLDDANDAESLDQFISSLTQKDSEENLLNDDIAKWCGIFLNQWRTLEKHRNSLKASKGEIPIQAIRSWLDSVFFEKIVILSDSAATGDQVNEKIVSSCPPGYINRIMGMQNIKGTGLDFVYRWQAWEQIYRWCKELNSGEEPPSTSALESLVAFQEYGLLDREHLPLMIQQARSLPHAQHENFQAMLNRLESKHQSIIEAQASSLENIEDEMSPWKAKVLAWVEPMLDSGDAVRRRKKADQIYADLIGGRIAMDLATVELRKLTKRQKGGWLSKRDK